MGKWKIICGVEGAVEVEEKSRSSADKPHSGVVERSFSPLQPEHIRRRLQKWNIFAALQHLQVTVFARCAR